MPTSKECTNRTIENSRQINLAADKLMREKQGLGPRQASNEQTYEQYLNEMRGENMNKEEWLKLSEELLGESDKLKGLTECSETVTARLVILSLAQVCHNMGK